MAVSAALAPRPLVTLRLGLRRIRGEDEPRRDRCYKEKILK